MVNGLGRRLTGILEIAQRHGLDIADAIDAVIPNPSYGKFAEGLPRIGS